MFSDLGSRMTVVISGDVQTIGWPRARIKISKMMGFVAGFIRVGLRCIVKENSRKDGRRFKSYGSGLERCKDDDDDYVWFQGGGEVMRMQETSQDGGMKKGAGGKREIFRQFSISVWNRSINGIVCLKDKQTTLWQLMEQEGTAWSRFKESPVTMVRINRDWNPKDEEDDRCLLGSRINRMNEKSGKGNSRVILRHQFGNTQRKFTHTRPSFW